MASLPSSCWARWCWFVGVLRSGGDRRAAVPGGSARRLSAFEPVSILKPLHGVDDGLEANFRSFFEQDHPTFEILFAARHGTTRVWRWPAGWRPNIPHVPAGSSSPASRPTPTRRSGASRR
jgi:hypothetical protein